MNHSPSPGASGILGREAAARDEAGRARDRVADPAAGKETSDRVLIVSAQFPPSGGIGARRVVQISRLFAERWCDVDVLTLPAAEHAVTLPESMGEVAPGTRIGEVPLGRLPFIASLKRFIRPLFSAFAGGAPATSKPTGAAPKREQSLATELRRSLISIAEEVRSARWVRRSERVAASFRPVARYRAVLSSGPPHLAHLAAARLARRYDVPLIIDLRDPWADRQVIPPDADCRLGLYLARRAERRCLRQANVIVANNPVAHADLVARIPEIGARTVTALNGGDGEIRSASARDGTFRIVYAGSLYQGRDPEILFRAVRVALDALGEDATRVRIEFAGDESYDDRPVQEIARACGVAEHFVHAGRLNASGTDALLARADLLVSLPQMATRCVPAKLFEYANYSAWLLVFADTGSATEVVFRDSGARIVRMDAIDEAAAVIVDCVRRSTAGEVPMPVNADGHLQREHQLELLWNHLRRLGVGVRSEGTQGKEGTEEHGGSSP